MKPTFLFATLSLICASAGASAKSELETLRARCAEQERQIAQLEQNNSNARAPHALGSSSELISVAATKPTEVTKSPEARPPAVKSGSTIYTVKAGDSIEKIADSVKSTPSTLAKINGVKTNAIIHPGQQLKVPATAKVTAKSEPTPPSKAPAVATSDVRKKYTVQDNDTFSSISRKQKISVASLVAANPSVKPTKLHTGQVLNLGISKPAPAPASVPTPVAKTSAPAPATQAAKSKTPPRESSTPAAATKTVSAPSPSVSTKSEPAPTPPATAAQENSSPSPEKKVHPVTIDGEITYGEFATQHGTNPERLNALNGLDLTHATVLAKGSELYVPAQP